MNRRPTAENLARMPAPNSRLHHIRRFTRLLGGASQIVFGTDYPYGGAQMADDVEALFTVGFTPEELRGIDRPNALGILPKYAS